MDGGFLRLHQVRTVEQVAPQTFPVGTQGRVTGLAALDEHTDDVEDLPQQLVGGAIGPGREPIGLLEKFLGDTFPVPIDVGAVVGRGPTLGQVAASKGMHDVRKRVEAQPHRIPVVLHVNCFHVTRYATGGVRPGGEGIQGKHPGLAPVEEGHGLRLIPGEQRAMLALRARLQLGVEVGSEQGGLARLRGAPDRQGLPFPGRGAARVRDGVERIEPTAPGQRMVGMVLDPLDAELPIPIEGLG